MTPRAATRAASVLLVIVTAACGSTPAPTSTIGASPGAPAASASPGPEAPGTPVPASADPTNDPTTVPPTDGDPASIEARIAAMSTEEKVGQLFMVSFYGDQVSESDPAAVHKNNNHLGVDNAAQLVAQYHVGGAIYFTWAGNLNSVGQTARLSNGIQAAAAATPGGIPLLISTDQEGGSVARLPPPAPPFAGNMALGAGDRPRLARSAAQAMGEELRAVGINANLAPDADVNVNPANPVIGVRSFGSDPQLVATMAAAQVRGYEVDAGIAATAKHFPGHGDTNIDSHTGLPIIHHSLEQWHATDAPPFAAAIGAGVDVIMSAHISVPALDPTGVPATLSKPILTGILRGELGFDGVVITDSLGMAALRKTYNDARIPVLAILAGADMLLDPPSLPVAYGAVLAAVRSTEISIARLNASVRRILELKAKLGLFNTTRVNLQSAEATVGSATHLAAERDVAAASVTLVANGGGVLPIRPTSAGNVLVVGPDAPSLSTLAHALRQGGVTTDTYGTGINPSSTVIANAVSRGATHAFVVVLTRNADAAVQQRRLVDALAATATPVIAVAVARPYDVAYYDADAVLCLYSSSPASLRALASALLGDINPTGKLPVTIPTASTPNTVLYDFGFGLSYP